MNKARSLNLTHDPQLATVLQNTPVLPQRQDSTEDQLRDLIPFAVRLGLYDAADAIQALIKPKD